MSKQVQITLEMGKLERLMDETPRRAHAVLDKAAFDVKRTAQPMTAFEFGAMRNSIYVNGTSGGKGSEYGDAVSEALSRRPGVRILDEVQPNNEFERVVGVAVEYAYWQELQKPYLTPAVEIVRPQVTEAWRQLLK